MPQEATREPAIARSALPVTMVRGVVGFDQFLDFVLEPIVDAPPFLLLQSTREQDVSFIVIEPQPIARDYNPEIPAWALSSLGKDVQSKQIEIFCIVTLDGQGSGTVNLRAPVLLHRKNLKALQVILDDKYPIRHPLRVQ